MTNKTFTVKEGTPAKLNLPVTGIPKPDCVWSKDGKIIKEDTRINFESTPTSNIMLIKQTRREDAGKLICCNLGPATFRLNQFKSLLERMNLGNPSSLIHFIVHSVNPVVIWLLVLALILKIGKA